MNWNGKWPGCPGPKKRKSTEEGTLEPMTILILSGVMLLASCGLLWKSHTAKRHAIENSDYWDLFNHVEDICSSGSHIRGVRGDFYYLPHAKIRHLRDTYRRYTGFRVRVPGEEHISC